MPPHSVQMVEAAEVYKDVGYGSCQEGTNLIHYEKWKCVTAETQETTLWIDRRLSSGTHFTIKDRVCITLQDFKSPHVRMLLQVNGIPSLWDTEVIF